MVYLSEESYAVVFTRFVVCNDITISKREIHQNVEFGNSYSISDIIVSTTR